MTDAITNDKLTFYDVVSSNTQEGDKRLAMAMLLAQTNSLLMDMPMLPTTGDLKHEYGVQTSLPTIAHRRLNRGVAASKGSFAKAEDVCQMFESRLESDELNMLVSGHQNTILLQKKMHIEALNQGMQLDTIYGNTTVSPDKILGFNSRYNAISGADYAQNMIDCGGTGTDNTSLLLIGWSPLTVHGIYPKNSTGGIRIKSKSDAELEDENGLVYDGERHTFQWSLGIAVPDWRYVVRVCNIDVSDLVARTSTQAIAAATNILYAANDAQGIVPTDQSVKWCYYGNTTLINALRKMGLDKSGSNSGLTIEEATDQFGKPMKELRLFGLPLRRVDAMLNTEAQVV